ncbi:MAG: histidine-type phosphatase [Clostridia bacterium]|nr:histidine-type phosphatase [Clostridia bacterium]
MKRIFAILLAVTCFLYCCPATAEQSSYTLDRVVILSRHNIRSPLSGSGSLLGDITPHEWFEWTSRSGELSLRGAVSETMMGQYFRLWLEQEGLIPENWRPEEGAVRFYANAKQRTLATAKYFSAGLLPVADVPVESHAEYDAMDPVFEPSLNFVTDEYVRDAVEQISSMGGEAGLDGILANLNDAVSLVMDVADIEQSEAYQSGQYGDLRSGETTLTLEEGKEPKMTGPIKTATSVADALTFQYYEETDDKKAAFGHDLSEADWQLIHTVVDVYGEMLFSAPLVSVNVAHPLLEEIRSEMTAENRKFSFLCGHDSNVCSVLAAMNAEEYLLPETVEQHTPIGVKLVFERWVAEGGEAFWKVSMVYQSTAQLRALEQLTLENPPVKYPIRFEGIAVNDDGMIPEADMFTLLDTAIDAYDDLLAEYTAEEEKAA